MIKISIITATYNAAATLEACMDSVLRQSYPHIEYIVIDGASTDNSLDIIKQKAEHHPQIKWLSEPDKGIYDALNKGITMATGEVIGLVHADDLLAHNEVIAQIVAAFKTFGCDGVYGDLHYVNARDTTKVVRNWQSQNFKSALLKRGWMPPHPTLYLKTSLYRTHGLFDTSFRIAADYELVLRLFKQPQLRFHYLPETIVNMRVGGASNRSLQNVLQKSKEDYRALKIHRMPLPWLILLRKNLSKIPQFFK
jgi:glycosyltransferase